MNNLNQYLTNHSIATRLIGAPLSSNELSAGDITLNKDLKRVIVLGTVFVVVFVATIFFKPTERAEGNNGSKVLLSDTEKFMLEAANKLNSRLPLTVDSETRLNTTIGVNNEFRYNYSMINYAAEETDSKAFKDEIKLKAKNAICSGKEMNMFFDKGISVTYAYHGKKGKLITAVTVKPNECENS